MRTNYHTHTYRCNHAVGSEKDYLLSAIEKNVSILGFSDHAPFKDDRYESKMKFSELEEYISIVNSLKKEYSDKIDVKLGLEIEYDREHIDYYKELLNDYKLDYLVLGQHFYKNSKNEFINTYVIDNSEEYIEYANSVIEGMKTGFFKFLAHPDVIFINNVAWDKNTEKCCDLIIDAACENDFILEFNVNFLRRGLKQYEEGMRYAYPYKPFWDKVAKKDIKVIINSDCHNPDYIWDSYMDEGYKMAKEWGINVINEIF